MSLNANGKTFDDILREVDVRQRWEIASLDDWRAALIAAWELLCQGEGGEHVDIRRETWEQALSRVAAGCLATEQKGRRTGEPEPEWVEVLEYVSRMSSGAPDGLVQGPNGMRLPLSSVPRARR